MSPAYLVTPFLTAQLVLAVLPAEQGWFCQQDTQGLAPSMTQLLEMFLQGLVTPQPSFLTCWVWVTTPQCPTCLPSQDLTRPITDEAVALPAKLGSKGPSPVPAAWKPVSSGTAKARLFIQGQRVNPAVPPREAHWKTWGPRGLNTNSRGVRTVIGVQGGGYLLNQRSPAKAGLLEKPGTLLLLSFCN